MSQRIYGLDLEFENILKENTILRERVNKIGEIEPYVNILLQNNKTYQQEIATLQIDNNKLRGKIDDILQQTIVLKEGHKNEMATVKNGLEGDIDRLVMELKEILRDKEAMENANLAAIDELQSRFRRELQAKRIQKEQLETQSSHHIHKLTQSLKSKEKQFENFKLEAKNKEMNLNKQIEGMNIEINGLLKAKSLLQQDNNILTEEKHSVIKKNKELYKQNEEISTSFLRSEQDKNQSIIQLKNYNRDLTEEIDSRGNQIRDLEKLIADLNRKLTHLTKQCDEISRKYNELEGLHRQNLRETSDLKNQFEETSERLQLVSKTTTMELNEQANRIADILDQNKKMSSDNIEIQKDNRDKKAEIQDLLRVVDRLESKVKELDENCLILEDQNIKYKDKNKILQEELADSVLDRKSLTEKLNLYLNHNRTLEEVVEKEKKRNMCLQNSRNEFQHIALSRGEGICKQYEQEIEKMVEDFIIEKKQSEERHTMEISNIRKMYEASLREKDEYFNRKISFLEKEISGIRPFKAL